jgi:hypothetical protein
MFIERDALMNCEAMYIKAAVSNTVQPRASPLTEKKEIRKVE